jgi:hypothetical protein
MKLSHNVLYGNNSTERKSLYSWSIQVLAGM